jgi:Na+/proline symporter
MHDEINSVKFGLAFMGALFALTFWPQNSRRVAFTHVIMGTVISVVSVPGVLTFILWKFPTFPVEPAIVGAAHFWTGLLGMQAVPVAASILGRFKNVDPGV